MRNAPLGILRSQEMAASSGMHKRFSNDLNPSVPSANGNTTSYYDPIPSSDIKLDTSKFILASSSLAQDNVTPSSRYQSTMRTSNRFHGGGKRLELPEHHAQLAGYQGHIEQPGFNSVRRALGPSIADTSSHSRTFKLTNTAVMRTQDGNFQSTAKRASQEPDGKNSFLPTAVASTSQQDVISGLDSSQMILSMNEINADSAIRLTLNGALETSRMIQLADDSYQLQTTRDALAHASSVDLHYLGQHSEQQRHSEMVASRIEMPSRFERRRDLIQRKAIKAANGSYRQMY